MKKRTKNLGVVVMLLLSSTLLFAQGTKDTASDASMKTEKSDYCICEDPITLTAHIHYGDVFVMDNDKWTITKEAGKLTGVYLEGVASPLTTSSTEAFNMMIASHDIPDIVGGNNSDLMKYGTEGAFLPLNDLIEEYAPNFNEYLCANPDVRACITASDGNIYFIPMIYQEGASEAWFIRKDWLDEFELEVPQTVDELHDALLTFRNEDANGNGVKDEVGYFSRGVREYYLNGLLNLMGVNNYWHSFNGKVAYGPYTPEYKDAMIEIAKWYSEGLIDPEVFTRGNKAREILYAEDNGALIHDWIPSTSGYNTKMKDIVPGFELVGMLPPADTNGIRWESCCRTKVKGLGWGLGYKCSDPVSAIKYMDFWWSDRGRLLMTYGIEGDTYTMVDGEPCYTDKILNANCSLTDAMRKIGGQTEVMGYLHDASYEKFAMSEAGAIATEEYNKSGMVNAYKPQVGSLGFTEQELKTINEKFPTCSTYINETMQKWTFDGSRIEKEFDQYMKNLKNMGMDEVVAAYQSAWDRAYK
jgi:putative aldouronate transport system substrate-binding protein